jgi:hypothetical protein
MIDRTWNQEDSMIQKKRSRPVLPGNFRNASGISRHIAGTNP